MQRSPLRLLGSFIFVSSLLMGCKTANSLTSQLASAFSNEPEPARQQTSQTSERGKPTPKDTGTRTLRESDLKGLSWRSIGPANMGGRVADIAVAPGNAKTYFIAYGTGGLWKTINAGTTFSPVFDDKETASIGAVAVVDAPPNWSGWADEETEDDDTSDNDKKGKAKIVWVGTGEGNGRNSSSWGHGVYVSTDGGGAFTHVGLEATHDIPQLEVDPRNPDVCYVAAMGHLWGTNEERGLYKTTDRGQTWEKILYVDDTTGCCDVRIDPNNPDTIYAAMYTRQRRAYSFLGGGPHGGIFRSDDAGKSWTKLTEGLPAETGRIGLDLYLKDPSIIYAMVESDVGGRSVSAWHNNSKAGGVFRSDDRGDSWTRMNDFSPRQFYFSRIRVDPTDDQRVYVPGWGLSVSDDGGKHFRHGLASIVHVDFHAMWIDPADADHILVGTDGGLYASWDKGETWDFHNHMAVGQFYNITVDLSDPYRVGGGMQDNGSWIGPSESLRQTGPNTLGEPGKAITNADWDFISGGDGFHVAFDPQDPNIIYAESQGGEIVRIHRDTGKRKRLIPTAKEGEPRYRFNWNAPFFISPHDHTTLYHAGNHVFKFTERGENWTRISDDLSARELDKIITVGSDAETFGTVVSLAESPRAKGMIWAGTDDGLIHVTTNDGAQWNNVTPPAVAGHYISKIEPSRHATNTAYVAVDGHRSDDMNPHILMTTDAGASWTDITGDLPEGGSVKVVREDVRSDNVLYCGTERAAYVSINRGKSWVKLNGKSLPTVSVDDLAVHPREIDLVAGTHGRSAYILDDASPLSQLTPAVMNSELHLFDIPDGKPRIYQPYGGLWSHRMFRATNKKMGARISYWIRDYTGDEVKVTITNEQGKKLRTLTGTNRPGINRVVWDLQDDPKQRLQSFGGGGQTQFVPPGQYKVSLSMGEVKAKGTVTVLPSPIEDQD